MDYWSVTGRNNWLTLLLFLIGFAWPIHALAKPVTLAYQTPTLGSNLPIFVATELGLFAAENLEVKTVFIQGGPTAMAALIMGDVDYIKVAGVPAVRAIAQGTPRWKDWHARASWAIAITRFSTAPATARREHKPWTRGEFRQRLSLSWSGSILSNEVFRSCSISARSCQNSPSYSCSRVDARRKPPPMKS